MDRERVGELATRVAELQHGSDIRTGWTDPQPRDEFAKDIGIRRCGDLHRTIGTIAHPPSNTEPTRLLPREPPIPDALYASSDLQPDALHASVAGCQEGCER